MLLLNIALWSYSRSMQAKWLNVPPVPTKTQALAITMGDPQFAYRFFGLTLQNLGDTGGKTRNFKEYNYKKLGQWFTFLDAFDKRSHYLPFLAGFYYGSTYEQDDIEHIIDYLVSTGQTVDGKRWRWLAHAVFLAKYHMKDTDKALEVAEKLSDLAIKNPEMPAWSKHMKALIMVERGEKQAAFEFMTGILYSEADNLDPSEIEFMRYHICTRILDEEAAKVYPLCKQPIKQGAGLE